MVGGGEEGALDDALAPVFGGTERPGQEPQQLARVGPRTQEPAVLCLPQDGHGVDGSAAPVQGRQALPQPGVQRVREVAGRQPPHLLDAAGAGGHGREEQPLLVCGFFIHGRCRRGSGRAGQGSGMRGEAGGDVVHHVDHGVSLFQGGGHALGE